MPEFGDELIIESYKVPWLIWIQLLITILLILLLLFGFSLFSSDSLSSSSTALPSNGRVMAAAPPTNVNGPSSSRRRTKVGDQRVRRDEETSGVGEENQTGEESSLKDDMSFRNFRYPNHPCNYIEQVKRAFLKCLGLDPSSELSNSHRREKQE